MRKATGQVSTVLWMNFAVVGLRCACLHCLRCQAACLLCFTTHEYFGNANANANASSSRRLWAAARASAAQNKQTAKRLSGEDITINRMYSNITSEITHCTRASKISRPDKFLNELPSYTSTRDPYRCTNIVYQPFSGQPFYVLIIKILRLVPFGSISCFYCYLVWHNEIVLKIDVQPHNVCIHFYPGFSIRFLSQKEKYPETNTSEMLNYTTIFRLEEF